MQTIIQKHQIDAENLRLLKTLGIDDDSYIDLRLDLLKELNIARKNCCHEWINGRPLNVCKLCELAA